jgi:hypothetical protein
MPGQLLVKWRYSVARFSVEDGVLVECVEQVLRFKKVTSIEILLRV